MINGGQRKVGTPACHEQDVLVTWSMLTNCGLGASDRQNLAHLGLLLGVHRAEGEQDCTRRVISPVEPRV
jgi:hypothetical protein